LIRRDANDVWPATVGGIIGPIRRSTREVCNMAYRDPQQVHEPTPVHEESNGLVGYAAIKYTAIVVIVLSILAFLAWYVLPRIP